MASKWHREVGRARGPISKREADRRAARALAADAAADEAERLYPFPHTPETFAAARAHVDAALLVFDKEHAAGVIS